MLKRHDRCGTIQLSTDIPIYLGLLSETWNLNYNIQKRHIVRKKTLHERCVQGQYWCKNSEELFDEIQTHLGTLSCKAFWRWMLINQQFNIRTFCGLRLRGNSFKIIHTGRFGSKGDRINNLCTAEAISIYIFKHEHWIQKRHVQTIIHPQS